MQEPEPEDTLLWCISGMLRTGPKLADDAATVWGWAIINRYNQSEHSKIVS